MRYRNRNPHVARGEKKFTFRRPDISVLRCLKPGSRLWSDDVLVAIEITSANDEVDFNDKRAEYAAQGIPVYLIVVMDGDGIDTVEEHRLDWSGRNYQLVAAHRHAVVTELPEGIKLNVAFPDLVLYDSSMILALMQVSLMQVAGWLGAGGFHGGWLCWQGSRTRASRRIP